MSDETPGKKDLPAAGKIAKKGAARLIQRNFRATQDKARPGEHKVKKVSMFDAVKKAVGHEKDTPEELRFKKLMNIGLTEAKADKYSVGKTVTLADGATPVKLKEEDETAFKAFYKQVYSQKSLNAEEQKARVDEWVTKVVEYRAADSNSKDVHAMADGYMKAKDKFTIYEAVMEKGAISSLADGYAAIINKQTKGEVNREVGFEEYAKVASAQLLAEEFDETQVAQPVGQEAQTLIPPAEV